MSTANHKKIQAKLTARATREDLTVGELCELEQVSLDPKSCPRFLADRITRILNGSAAVSPASPAGKKGIVRVVEAEKTDSSEALREQYKEIQRTGSQAKASAFYDLHRDVFAPDQRQRARS